MLTRNMSDRLANSEQSESGERPACLVLHGLGGGPYELEPLVASLKAEGLSVACPVLPGHFGPGPVMPPSRWREWAIAAEQAFDELAATGKPVAIVGFSTGATVALYLASRRSVARQVLLAPFLAIRFTGLIPLNPSIYLRWLARVVPDVPRRPPAVRDRAMRGRAWEASIYRTFSVPSALSALELIDELTPEISLIKTPTLIIQGKRDTVVQPARAGWLHQKLGSTEKTLVILDESDHLVALDCQRDRTIRESLAFLLGRGLTCPRT
jgi:carboxylesterase